MAAILLERNPPAEPRERPEDSFGRTKHGPDSDDSDFDEDEKRYQTKAKKQDKRQKKRDELITEKLGRKVIFFLNSFAFPLFETSVCMCTVCVCHA